MSRFGPQFSVFNSPQRRNIIVGHKFYIFIFVARPPLSFPISSFRETISTPLSDCIRCSWRWRVRFWYPTTWHYPASLWPFLHLNFFFLVLEFNLENFVLPLRLESVQVRIIQFDQLLLLLQKKGSNNFRIKDNRLI